MKLGAPKIYSFLGLSTQGDIGPYTMYTAKDRALVIFLQAPPKKPPSRRQVHQRDRFRAVALQWKALPAKARADWSLAARAARLRCTGYNVFTFWLIRNDLAAVNTIEHQSGITLDKTANPI